MAQFDVHKNSSEKTSSEFPFLLVIQSNLFNDSTRVVVVPLVFTSALVNKDPTLNPKFDIEGSSVTLFPLDIASMSKHLLGDKVANIGKESDRIVAALDLLFARF